MRTLKELGAYGRANPGKLNAGSSSAIATIAPTLLREAAENFDLQVILYKSETTALNDLIAGRIQVMLITGTLAQHVRDGRARGLATLVTSAARRCPTCRRWRRPACRRSRLCRSWACSGRRRCRGRSSNA